MKKYYSILFPALILAVAVTLSGFGDDGLKSSGGAPAGYTNSPADGKDCSHCMGGTSTPVTGWVTSNIPSSGYILGQTYTIIVTGTGTTKKGFQLSPQDPAGTLIGVLTPQGNTKLVGLGKYITHTTPNTSNPAIWTFEWTAPSTETGDVVFYASIALGKTDTRTTTLTVSQSTVGMETNTAGIRSLYPNPAKDLLTVDFFLPAGATCSADFISLSGKTHPAFAPQSFSPGSHSVKVPVDLPAALLVSVIVPAP